MALPVATDEEWALLQRLADMNEGGRLPDKSIIAIYREIMSSSLSLEKTMTIAYLGPEATFTHQAALQKFGASLIYSAQKTIGDVFTEVAHGRADYGVAPVENSTEGAMTALRRSRWVPARGVSSRGATIDWCSRGWGPRRTTRRGSYIGWSFGSSPTGRRG